jgi:soluble lytic murein transglycosylase-like protein
MRTIYRHLFIIVAVLLPFVCLSASLYPKKYDKAFKNAAVILPVQWQLLKAQCWQESRLNPFAISPAGAYGLCQFMPDTANDFIRRYDNLNNLWLPDQSITAAAIYMGYLWGQWSAPRSKIDRYKLTLASYNAGLGNILAAQTYSGGENGYTAIIAELPQVTGEHSKETIEYVDLIVHKWWPIFLFDP